MLGLAAEEEVTTSTAHRPPLTVSPLFPCCTAPSTSSTLMEILQIIRCTGATVVADRKMDGSRKHPRAFEESLAASLQSPPYSPGTRNPTKSVASFSRRPFTPLPPSDTFDFAPQCHVYDRNFHMYQVAYYTMNPRCKLIDTKNNKNHVLMV